MPFDSAKLKQPVVTVLPPTPPERGGGPRVHVVIEIVDRRAVKKHPPHKWSLFTFWLIVLLLIAIAAHAQQRYEHWQDTNGWHGQTRTEGRTTDWDAYGPRGEQKHCHRYFVGDQPYTTCN
jgi:hypothetical protein